MSLCVVHDVPADGPGNMAADERLAECLPAGSVSLRFYGWSPSAVSIGAFQRADGIGEFPRLAALPFVRRPSGGGAIVHGTDLTYAIAVRREHPWGGQPQRLYEGVHAVVASVLRDAGLDATLFPDAVARPEGRHDDDGPWLCFDRRSPGDVVVAGSKVLGSAQRRHRFAVVQHGSLLLRSSPAHPEHRGLAELLGGGIDEDHLRREWIRRLALSLGLEPIVVEHPPEGGVESGWESSLARYRSDAWARRR